MIKINGEACSRSHRRPQDAGMKDFYALRGGRVINPAGHWTKDGADRAALATLRRHPKSVVWIVQIIDTHTLESAEMRAAYRRKSAMTTAQRGGK